MDTIFFLVQQAWFFVTPLLVVALGGLFSERNGVINIALEDIMLTGALCSIGFIHTFSHVMSSQLLLLCTVLAAGATGIVFSLFHAFAVIHTKAGQVISGTVLNTFAPVFCILIVRTFQQTQQIQLENVFHIESVPVLGSISIIGDLLFKNTYITTYIGLLFLVLVWVIIYKTRPGLRLRAYGELPQAADSVGISVYKMRYAGTLISGFLADIGGSILVVPISNVFNADVAGYGFPVLAVLIFGQWKSLHTFFATLFFGFMKTVAATSSGIPSLAGLNIPSYTCKMVPYIAALIVLTFVSRNSAVPAAEGEPFDEGEC